MSAHQKLGIILENKKIRKLNLEKNVFTKKWSLKLIFLNDFFFFEKNRLIFDIENWLWLFCFCHFAGKILEYFFNFGLNIYEQLP